MKLKAHWERLSGAYLAYVAFLWVLSVFMAMALTTPVGLFVVALTMVLTVLVWTCCVLEVVK